jgi:hypothetical protein
VRSNDLPPCPRCDLPLEPRDGSFWCTTLKRLFDRTEVEAAAEWRELSVSQKVERFKALGAVETEHKYLLLPQQVDEVKKLAADGAAIVHTTKRSVVPDKASLISLAKGISDESALCELIDNSIDAGRIKRPGEKISVIIRFDRDLRTLSVSDDAGGMSTEDMQRCFTLGAAKAQQNTASIGRYGIGAKEAIYHYGREVIVRSRLLNAESGIRTVVDADWLEDSEWTIQIGEGLRDVKPGTTSIEIGRLEAVTHDHERICMHLRHTYERLLVEGNLEVIVDGVSLEQIAEYVPLYPPHLYPRSYKMKSGNVDVTVRVMLILKPADAGGIVFYAQGRRFEHLTWRDVEVRMVLDQKVQKHTLGNHVRVEISCDGPIEEIPISANKDGLRGNVLLDTISRYVTKIVDPYIKAIPPLSQDGAMSFVNKIVVDSELAHPEAKCIDIGRIGDGKSIPGHMLGDLVKFKEFLAENLGKQKPTASEPIVATTSNNSKSPEPQHEQQKKPTPAIKIGASRTLKVDARIDCASDEQRSRVEGWLKQGEELGVLISHEWT